MYVSKSSFFERYNITYIKDYRVQNVRKKPLTDLMNQLANKQIFRGILILLTIFLALTARVTVSNASEYSASFEDTPSATLARANYNTDLDIKNSRIFIFSGNKLLVTEDTLTPATLSSEWIQRIVKFSFKGDEYSAAELRDERSVPGNMKLADFIGLYLKLPAEIIEPARKGHQLLEWEALHKFCGKCGASTINSPEEHFKLCSNNSCRQKYYPKIMPVIVVGIERGDEILMARGPSFPKGIYTTLAGFVEAGETLEEAAKREVKEETGIEIGNLEYVGSQSWQSPTQIIIGFRAQYESGNLVIDHNELEHAAFFHAESLPPTFPGENLTISQVIISSFYKRYLERKQNAQD